MNGVTRDGAKLHSWEYNGDMGQCFSFNETAAHEYSILCDDFALKASDEGIILTKKEARDKLIVTFEKID